MKKVYAFLFLFFMYIQSASANPDLYTCLKEIDAAIHSKIPAKEILDYKASAICSDVYIEPLKDAVDNNEMARTFLYTLKASRFIGETVPVRIYNAAIAEYKNRIINAKTANGESPLTIDLKGLPEKLCYEKQNCNGLCSASNRLKSASFDLYICASKFDFSEDCYRKYKDVRDAHDNYMSILSNAHEYCKE